MEETTLWNYVYTTEQCRIGFKGSYCNAVDWIHVVYNRVHISVLANILRYIWRL
jgi:hypothetical protein